MGGFLDPPHRLQTEDYLPELGIAPYGEYRPREDSWEPLSGVTQLGLQGAAKAIHKSPEDEAGLSENRFSSA